MACYDQAPYTCTYDSGGGKDYDDMALWETASEADIGGYSGRVILDCFDSQDHDDSILLNDADNNATASIYRIVRSASGCSTPFAGKKNTGANFVATVANNPFNLSEPYARVEQFVVSNSRNTSGTITGVALLSDNAKAIDIVVEDVTNIGSGLGYGIFIAESNDLAYACIVYSCKTAAIHIGLGGGETSGAVCCTAVGSAIGFDATTGGTRYLFSCYAQDNTTEITEANWSGGDWNASKGDDTADLGGTATYYDNSQDWSGSLDGDYLATASIDADAGGVGDNNSGKNPVNDLSGVWDPDSFFTGADALFGFDIAGNARPGGADAAWDVGASEFVGVGGSAALTGTAVAGGVLESEIVTGSETIIITLTDDTWIAAGTGPIGTDANTQALIDGIDGDVAGGTGWDEKVKALLVPDDDVVRDSNTQATVTLVASVDYAISSDETITVTIPAEVLTGGEEIVADATFVVTNETVGLSIPIAQHYYSKMLGSN